MARVQIAFTVEPAVFALVEKRAATMNLKPGDYARRLFEAGYAARIGQERGMPTTDAELDAAVRSVFPLAGSADARTIARATGFTKGLVENILRGFRLVAAEPTRTPVERLALPAPEPRPAQDETAVTTPAMAEPSAVVPPRGWTAADFQTALKMYAERAIVRVIADALGRKQGAVEMMMSKRRDLFPKRSAAA